MTHPAPSDSLPWLSSILPDTVVLRQVLIGDGAWPLRPEESPTIARAVPRRRAEFAAGRHCARVALMALCGKAPAVPSDARRAPRWPQGIVGSITHDARFAAAAVAWRRDVAGLGIDIDEIDRFEDSLATLVCTGAELERWHAAPVDARRRLLAMTFCAKEACYKALSPLTGAWLDFADLALDALPASGDGFRARLQVPAGRIPAGTVIDGRIAFDATHCAAAVVLPADGPFDPD